MDNIGLVLFGSGTEGGGGVADRQIDICLVFDPNAGCAGVPFRVTLPIGGVQKVINPSNSVSDWPNAFPGAMFNGWGGAVVTHDRYPITGKITRAESGVLTIISPDNANHFPVTLVSGNKITIPGSGCIPNDLCTISLVTHAGALQLSDKVSGSNLQFTAHSWAVLVQKVTSTGSISVGVQQKSSGTINSATIAEGFKCHPVEVTSSDGIKGHTCAIPGPTSGYRYLYFIANDGSTKRAISALSIPRSKLQSWPVQDRPHSAYDKGGAAGFSLTDGRIFYSAMPTTTGSWSIFRLTYNGDWKTEVDYNYKGGWGGDLPETAENLAWENIMPTSQGKDLSSQIAKSYPAFQAKLYGDWNTPQFGGFAGSKAFFYKLLGGQDGGPCWIATVDIPSGTVISLVNTFDEASIPELQWGNCHSVAAAAWPPDTLAISLNALVVADNSRMLAGPFEVRPNAVLRAGFWSPDTSLPWPIDDSYNNQCPTDLLAAEKELGAVGNQCVTFRLPGNPCNLNPSIAERAAFPACNWNPAFTMPKSIQVGNHFADKGLPTPGDSEPFRAVRVTALANGDVIVIAQRNAAWDYCCAIGSRPGNGCVNGKGRLQHANAWTLRMYTGTKNSCHGSLLLVSFSGGTPQPFEVAKSLGASHYAVGRNGNNIDFMSAFYAKTNIPLKALADLTVTGSAMRYPSFAGMQADIGGLVQEYFSHSQTAATQNIDNSWALDSNAYNPSYGWSGGNTLNNALASRQIVRIAGDVWKIGLLGGIADYKRRPLIGWAGSRMLKDVSGPASQIASAASYSFCHVLRAGDCGIGSVGETFIKAPNVYPHASCVAAIVWANVPCVMSASPGVGGVRQFEIPTSVTPGAGSRLLTYGLGIPGAHNPFFGAASHPSGKSMLVSSGQYLGGVRMASMLFRLPEWRVDSTGRGDFGGLTVTVPKSKRSDATHARIKFGYNTAFHCSERLEACVTDLSGAPYAFEGEGGKPSPCANGCAIEVPVLTGRIIYFQAEFLAKGLVVEAGEETAVVVTEVSTAAPIVQSPVPPAQITTTLAIPPYIVAPKSATQSVRISITVTSSNGSIVNGGNVTVGCRASTLTPVASGTAVVDCDLLLTTTGTKIEIAVQYSGFGQYGPSSGLAVVTTSAATPSVNPSADLKFVTFVYTSTLGRNPSAEESSAGLNKIALSGRSAVVTSLYNSPEFNRVSRFAAGLYIGILNRDAETQGWLWQRAALVGGAPPDLVVRNFLESAEFVLKNGQLQNTDFVRLLYRQVLLREAAPSEVLFQTGALSPTYPRSSMASGFLASAEFWLRSDARLTTSLLYSTLLNRDPTSGESSSTKQLLSSGSTLTSLVSQIVSSSEFLTRLQKF
ncbi:MAG: DUF4214 domain-containing protein [Bryobacteraceae bacterium]|nr:DUF4214 domain-containing protein [Bryobacteraceae bacterium]